MDSQQLERTFVDQLPAIERAGWALSRRYGLAREEAEDFVSTARLKILENDYEVLRKFRGESSLPTYLSAVVASIMREYHVQRWGRWRPSAEAKRSGPVAIRLEVLVYKNGYALSVAGEMLRSAGVTSLSDRELAQLLDRLPRRSPPRPVPAGAEPLAAIPTTEAADTAVDDEGAHEERRHAEECLRRALARLAVEDRMILTLRFWQGLTIAEISRALVIQQKSLYRRVEKLLVTLRAQLKTDGVLTEHIQAMIEQARDDHATNGDHAHLTRDA